MVLFINDRPVRLTDAQRAELIREKSDYDVVIDTRLEVIKSDNLHGHVLILNASLASLERLMDILHDEHPSALQSILVQVADKKGAESRLKNYFKVVKAAGGVVFKNDQVLLIYRLKRWDLPKGKLDPGEKSKEASVREVNEETGLEVELGEKICTTWHTYTHNGNRILKRTKWYRMTLLDESHMQPQWEEDIEKISWMTRKEVQNALVDSYSSIRYVFEQLWSSVPELD
ncbi:NUDIX hydrolase [Siphonobacter aquaeclarae]|jgi:8-oxo-dGTP pyrophosphatase MutT (NUDIX family)|uniref:ADP-ribose pyrophosphatase YjhB, NUDIX family n=1 Tax=Siphonobacter aquaeclarae TaxID=563176 RepID=A0A1G9NLH8_9BACT|nr:NUDIX domain-containing protein [Siphonobacter aquaeclarae]MBO9637475.1 NUDIX domain-containing protein [Siphonobacter aquaeclarae]SDL87462.1 ADP-ribose pyrophosphatase YjhB, NUDIX family [Siphonobacter aquaeclarae]